MSEPQRPYLAIPPALQKVFVAPGKWNKFIKLLVTGRYKTGKSYFLASMPKPILAASGGDEHGLAQYLDSAAGDMCFNITTPDQLAAFVSFAAEHAEKNFASCVLDPVTLIYDDYRDAWAERLGGEIRGKGWSEVKAPWKIFRRMLKNSRLHVGMSAHLKEVQYESEVSDVPGEKDKLIIKPVEVPKVEAQLPYDADLMFQLNVQTDRKSRPTPFHEIVFLGGRRPRTIPPTELYTGKKWVFDERKPESPWERIVLPILTKWQDAAAGAVDFVGVDPREAAADSEETQQIVDDYLLGSMLRTIGEQTKLGFYRDKIWPEKILPFVDKLKPEQRAQVMKAHEVKKKELEAQK